MRALAKEKARRGAIDVGLGGPNRYGIVGKQRRRSVQVRKILSLMPISVHMEKAGMSDTAENRTNRVRDFSMAARRILERGIRT